MQQTMALFPHNYPLVEAAFRPSFPPRRRILIVCDLERPTNELLGALDTSTTGSLGVDRMSGVLLYTMSASTTSSRSFSTGPILLQLDNDNDSKHELHVVDDIPPLPSLSPTRITTRPLRRKKHFSMSHRASAPVHSPVPETLEIAFVAARPQSMLPPSSPVVHNDRSRVSSPSRPSHNRSNSQPTNAVRLGHPTRPYYSAIRKNMSRPSSPVPPVPSRPTSMGLPSARPLSRASGTLFPPIDHHHHPFDQPDDEDDEYADDDDRDAPRARPRSRHRLSTARFSFGGLLPHRASSPASALSSGFSVSGEMEMRMALAALARDAPEGQPSASEYQFQETPPAAHGRIRRLGRGLKDLVWRRHGQS
ncbi:hypothetical protein C8J57DRAFT_1267952 [Mycena rebaudengoi]|nr:hypothetical protein C8J57DRAFT_1267952 [Mycena rebaudengoi]